MCSLCVQVKVAEYNTLKTQMNAALRKQTGSLSVRDISTIVKPQHVVSSENLTTLFVVVTRFGIQDWMNSHEKMANFVVGFHFLHLVTIIHPPLAARFACNNILIEREAII